VTEPIAARPGGRTRRTSDGLGRDTESTETRVRSPAKTRPRTVSDVTPRPAPKDLSLPPAPPTPRLPLQAIFDTPRHSEYSEEPIDAQPVIGHPCAAGCGHFCSALKGLR
jgi:hypothetical protein